MVRKPYVMWKRATGCLSLLRTLSARTPYMTCCWNAGKRRPWTDQRLNSCTTFSMIILSQPNHTMKKELVSCNSVRISITTIIIKSNRTIVNYHNLFSKKNIWKHFIYFLIWRGRSCRYRSVFIYENDSKEPPLGGPKWFLKVPKWLVLECRGWYFQNTFNAWPLFVCWDAQISSTSVNVMLLILCPYHMGFNQVV